MKNYFNQRSSTLFIWLIFFVILPFCPSIHAQVTGINYLMKLDKQRQEYDCFIIITKGNAVSTPDRIQFNAQYSLVIPHGVELQITSSYMPLYNNQNYQGIEPTNWIITSQIIAPEIQPANDFISIVPDLNPTSCYNNLKEGDTVKLFSFKTIPFHCADDVRLFINGVDPPSTVPSMKGSDFTNGFTIGNFQQDYTGNSYEPTNCTTTYNVKCLAFRDANGNGLLDTDTDFVLPNVALNLENSPNTFYSDADGRFDLEVDSGTYQLTAFLPYGQWQFNPLSQTISYAENDSMILFPFIPVPMKDEVLVNITTGIMRCNQYAPMFVSMRNTSSNIINGMLRLKLDKRTYVKNLYPPPFSVNDSIITWKVDALPSGAISKSNLLTFVVPESMPDDSLRYELSFVNNNDEALDNLSFGEKIRCSFDPNDKQSWPDRKGEENLTLRTEKLRYNIRFQNTGNDTAFYVRLDDVLDDNLNRRSLMILDASHPTRAVLCSNDTLCFIFDNISLTDSTTNFLESQGYVTFTIDNLDQTPENTVIKNTAGIVFDKNKAVITNTVQNTIVTSLPCPPDESLTQVGGWMVASNGGNLYKWYECNSETLIFTTDDAAFVPPASGRYYAIIESDYCTIKTECAEFKTTGVENEAGNFCTLYPAVFEDHLNVASNETILKSQLYDAFGRLVINHNQSSTENTAIIGTNYLTNGIYTMVVHTNTLRYVFKVIKVNM